MSYTFLLEQGEESSVESFSDIPLYVLSRLNLTREKSSCNGNGTESCQDSQYGTMYEPSTGSPGGDGSMLSAEDSPARTFQPPEKERESRGKGLASGRNLPESLAKYDPDSRSWKTHQCSLLGGLTLFSETWPRWGMMRNGELFQVPTPSGLMKIQAFITSESEFGSRRLSTPVSSDTGIRKSPYAQGGSPLSFQVTKVPTPMKADAERGGRGDLLGYIRASARGLPKYGRVTVPTPTKRDFRHSGSKAGYEKRKGKHVQALNEEVCWGPTGLQHGGSLNPPWVEWLMGWPLGWTELAPLEMDKFQQWCGSHGIPFNPESEGNA